ncbi:aminoacyl-tRNA hydrolase [Xylanimonas allomyrinae]|uniref:Peptidyl-tRNA hydrolase n=1 Tax=Xylanimonas allomyrinae TaxID=2509459 RepID=A0A4P6EIV8_9MICO|nr:aminoacyl-tRNA hydrolase [Xylanimonas allomyrinae]QAY61956.1 aminoacyl-tRNA hydrolase [Xylanimonas allomyrinae]
MSDNPWLVVGLGNPGAQYAGNRHNVGQMVLDLLAQRAGVRFSRHPRAQAVAGEGRLGVLPGGRPGPRLVLAKPTTYMNVSGGPVATLAAYYGVDAAHVLVVHDEVDIPFDTIKLKAGGGEGGHNGLRDITKALGTKDYVRVRVGVGRPPGRMDTADHVLRDFSAAEKKDLPILIDDAADAVEQVIIEGLLAAQGRFHARTGR